MNFRDWSTFSSIASCKITANEDYERNFAVGFGYPYISLRYKAVELKYASEFGVNVYGMRLNLNLKKTDGFILYAGIEGDYTQFDTEELKGEGNVLLLFLGGEFQIANKMSLYMDIGPGNISLKDTRQYNESVSGTEWIANVGIWLYFK